MVAYKVGYFVGSLSITSINRLLAKALIRLAPPELHLLEFPFRDLPIYSPAEKRLIASRRYSGASEGSQDDPRLSLSAPRICRL